MPEAQSSSTARPGGLAPAPPAWVRVLTNRWLINALLAAAAVCLAIGVDAPLLTLTKLMFIDNTFSLLSGVRELWRESQRPLALVIFLFSVVLPAAKILLLGILRNLPAGTRRGRRRWADLLETIGKWSMLDVFLVAILLASVKLGALASVDVHYGVYVFAAAVVLLIITGQLVRLYVRRSAG